MIHLGEMDLAVPLIAAVVFTLRWSEIEISDARIARSQEGLIVIAYHARASQEGASYEAHCTSTYRRLEHEVWRVVQHQQTPPLTTSPAQVEDAA